ncbi:MAG: hypothetical protein JZU65_22770, partial [Chlorobium sp.]|nr:hypothetical protein [Chlorobium sp.]
LSAKPEKTNCQFLFRANSCNSWATLPLHPHSSLNENSAGIQGSMQERAALKPAFNSSSAILPAMSSLPAVYRQEDE